MYMQVRGINFVLCVVMCAVKIYSMLTRDFVLRYYVQFSQIRSHI